MFKHLHGRGEDKRRNRLDWRLSETPPRTWRRRAHEVRARDRGGNTSTDVEKTLSFTTKATRPEKHLHGRGEDSSSSLASSAALETPPRTWRRPSSKRLAKDILRNTSTDVEKTEADGFGLIGGEKHLHGRGEDQNATALVVELGETPPRTWRRPFCIGDDCCAMRNTSTDVEKT